MANPFRDTFTTVTGTFSTPHFHVTDQSAGFTCSDPDCTGRHSFPEEVKMNADTAMFIVLNTALAVLALAAAAALVAWAWMMIRE